MRKILAPTLLALLAAGSGFAAETAVDRWSNVGADAAAIGADVAARASADPVRIPLSGSPVANSNRSAAVAVAVDAHLRKETAMAVKAPATAKELIAGMSDSTVAAGDEVRALDQASRVLVVAEMSGVVARDWQGTSALFTLDYGAVDLPRIALGVAVERLTLDDAPVVGAVEGVVRIDLPLQVGGRWAYGRLAVGPAVIGRVGSTLDGDLVIGIDMMAHAEIAIATGLGVVVDVGAGDRVTEHDAAGLQPSGSVGLAFVF